MKLRNKLIPLASVFATGVTIAPVVLTSCSANGMVDLTNGNYAITTKKAVTEGLVADKYLAMEKWMAEVNENPDVLIQDKYWSEAIMVKGFADKASINATSVKAQVKNVSVKYVTVKVDDVEYKFPTVSMTFTIAVETNWYTDGGSDSKDVSVEEAARRAKLFGAPMYYPIMKYYHDEDIPGNIYCSKVYESIWENIPVTFITYTETQKKYMPTINTDWFIAPVVEAIPYMEAAKLDWKYSVKYDNTDKFVFHKDGVETTKTYNSTLDRSFTSYDKLSAGPTSGDYYTRGDLVLASEALGSYYLSDLKLAE